MKTKSFLKWAGGKSRLADKISNLVGNCDRLVEPFAGSASVFLGTNYKQYLLCDTNLDLIDLFNHIKDKNTVIDFIKLTTEYFSGKYCSSEAYYFLRDRFNQLKPGDVNKSAIFLYLNKHAFNGLCRYNKSGQFNVPYAKLKKPPYYPLEEINRFHEKAVIAEFVHCDFSKTFEMLKFGDRIYCDPPYVSITDTNEIVSYSIGDFTNDDQLKLVELTKKSLSIVERVVISNHDTPFTREIYQDANIHTLDVQRSISRKGSSRVKVKEIMAVFES